MFRGVVDSMTFGSIRLRVLSRLEQMWRADDIRLMSHRVSQQTSQRDMISPINNLPPSNLF